MIALTKSTPFTSRINARLQQALKATMSTQEAAFFVWGDALQVVAEELARDPERAAAWRDALVAWAPGFDKVTQ
jgi:hypothetical protein